jgi:predicted transcriptional regulator YdeE
MLKLAFSSILGIILLLSSCKNNNAMEYQTKELPSFYVIGIWVRTTNQNGQSQKDIGELWGKYMQGNIEAKIQNKVSGDTYCVYTDYESDETGKYTTLLGYKVSSLDSIPPGMIGITVPKSTYRVYTSTGKLPDCVVNTWMNIWKTDINRKFAADFDVYGTKAKNQSNAEVGTFLSVK